LQAGADKKKNTVIKLTNPDMKLASFLEATASETAGNLKIRAKIVQVT
jgi:hypothetical protein